MKISDIKDLLNAEILTGSDMLDCEVSSAFCCDMMSDVLAYVKDQGVLVTGLVNPQVVRTANMMDIVCIVFVRGKAPTEEMIELAKECDIAVLLTEKRAFDTSGILYMAGLSRNIEG